MNSRNQSETECYNISVDFQSQGICDTFKSCSEVRLLSELMRSNENDSISINEDTTEIIVQLPNKCKCQTETFHSNNDAVIAASVLSVVVALALLIVLVVTIFSFRKTKNLDFGLET